MRCPYCIKVCSKCNKILVANKINFYKNKIGKYGLHPQCKECFKKYHKEYYQDNKEEIEKHYENNKEKKLEYQKEYNKKHREERLEYNKKHREERLKYNKEWRKNNSEYDKKRQKQWRENNPNKIFNNCAKRRQRLENQGNGITKEQWLEMMNFFEWRCAYSGRYLGNKENKSIRSIDHIVPLVQGGLNEIWNCVPMYNNYNKSKNTTDMLEWYQQQEYFSIDRLEKIYEWIEYAYNKWGNEIND